MKVEGDIYDDTLQLHVIDLILKDVGTSGYTEYDWGSTLADYFEDNSEKWPVMFFSIHSHHNMGVSPSGVDDKHLYDNISNFPFHLSVIVNNRLDFNARIATDMIIQTVGVRGMDSNYTSKDITDGKIIMEFSLPVSISGANGSEFQEEFDTIFKAKEATKVVNAQTHLPFYTPHYKLPPITKYSIGTINFKFRSLKEALDEIRTPEDVEVYLDQVEKLCIDHVEQGRDIATKASLFQLINFIDDVDSKHKHKALIVDGLGTIYSLLDDVKDDFQEVTFGNSKPFKDISRMTDKEWQEYLLSNEV